MVSEDFRWLFVVTQQLRASQSALNISNWSADGENVGRSVVAQRVLLPVDARREHRHHDAVRHRPCAIGVGAALVSDRRRLLAGAQHQSIPGSDGAAGPEPGASETAEELRHENSPERAAAHAVHDEVDGGVEGDEDVAEIGEMSPEQLEGGALDDGVRCECHLQRPEHLRRHGNQVTDNTEADDDHDYYGDAASGLERRGVDDDDRLTPNGRGAPRPREGVALEAAEAGGAVGVRLAEGNDDEGVQPDEDDRRKKVVHRQEEDDPIDDRVRSVRHQTSRVEAVSTVVVVSATENRLCIISVNKFFWHLLDAATFSDGIVD